MASDKQNALDQDASVSKATAGTCAAHSSDIEHKGESRKKEIGGREGPDPTRYGDWEKNGRCIDF